MQVQAPSGHSLFVARVTRDDLPADAEHADNYTTFYVVRNFGAEGVVFFYLAKGNPDAPRQVVGWYPNGRMWSSYGHSIEAAIAGLQEDGWKYATRR